MNFSDILASSVHDIKNSLSIITNNLEQLLNDPNNLIADRRKASLLQQQAQRVSNNMIQLLSLYKLDGDQLGVNIVECCVDDLFRELLALNHVTSEALGLALETRCDPDLCGYFDEDLVRGIINSTIGNAERYAKSRILLSAEQSADWLVIRVEDDGEGYPEELLEEATRAEGNGNAFSEGRTHLGLLFASRVAALHHSGERRGHIRLANRYNLSGSCFELWLP